MSTVFIRNATWASCVNGKCTEEFSKELLTEKNFLLTTMVNTCFLRATNLLCCDLDVHGV